MRARCAPDSAPHRMITAAAKLLASMPGPSRALPSRPGLLRSLGCVPQRIHLGERGLLGRFAPFRQSPLDCRKPPLELPVRRAQDSFRIAVEVPREIDHGEQQITYLGARQPPFAGNKLRLDLVCLLPDLPEHR